MQVSSPGITTLTGIPTRLHSDLQNLTVGDDHTQYIIGTGRSGMTGTFDFSGATEVKMPTPVNPSDAATKAYTDTAASSQSILMTAAESITAGAAVALGLYDTGTTPTFDNKAIFANATTGDISSSFTVGANSNRVLVVFCANGGNNFGTPTYNGVALTALDQASGSSFLGGGVYYMIAPPTGAHTFGMTNGSGAGIAAAVYSYYNVNQSTPFDSHGYINPPVTSSPVTKTVTPTQAEVIGIGYVLAAATNGLPTVTPTVGANNTTTNTTGAVVDVGDYGLTALIPQTASCTFTGGSNFGVSAGVVFLAPATPATVPAIFNTNTTTAGASAFRFNGYIGFVQNTVAAGQTSLVTVSGVVTGLSGIESGGQYYLTNTNGAIGLSAGSNTRKAGIGITASTLLITNIW